MNETDRAAFLNCTLILTEKTAERQTDYTQGIITWDESSRMTDENCRHVMDAIFALGKNYLRGRSYIARYKFYPF